MLQAGYQHAAAYAQAIEEEQQQQQFRDQVRGQLRNVAARFLSSGSLHHERVALGRPHNRRGRRRPVPAARLSGSARLP